MAPLPIADLEEKMMGALIRIWAVVLAAGLVGCKAGPAGEAAHRVAVGSSVTGGDTTASTSAAIDPPAPVQRAEALAEDVQTDLAQNAWPAAQAKVHELRSLGEKLDSAGVAQPKQSAYGRAVDSLAAAITHRSQSDALRAGNHVSRIVTGIMADYPTTVPVQLAYMDVAGRDVLYAAQRGRWSDAAAPTAELGRNYAAVQDYVRRRNFALDQVVTSEIAQLQQAVVSRRADRATSLASALLEDVDRLELIY